MIKRRVKEREKTVEDLEGKIFLGIKNNDYGGVKIKFGDGTVAYFHCDISAGGCIGEITLERIEENKNEEGYYSK